MVLTDTFEDSIALVEDEHLDVLGWHGLVLGEGEDSSWGSDDNVWGSCWVLEQLLVSSEGLAAIDDGGAELLHVSGHAVELTLDLVGELTVMAEDHGGDGCWVLVDALKDGQNKDSGLSHTRDGLAEDVDSEDGLWDALLLDI